jgi:hypothetical protein
MFFKGFSCMEILLDPGHYTIILSPEDTKQVGTYRIQASRQITPKIMSYHTDFSLQELTLKQYKYNTYVDGQWTFKNSKGTNRILTEEFQSFMKNPGYTLQVPTEPLTLRLHLVSTDPIIEGHEVPSLSICIFEILEDFRYRIFLEDDNYAGRSWGFYT